MKPLLRILTVTVLLIGQLGAGVQAWSPGHCHDGASDDAYQAGMHQQHDESTSHHHGDSTGSGDCHCVGGFHCGLAALATDTFPAGADAGEHPAYATAPCQRPGLAHRREVDRPPA